MPRVVRLVRSVLLSIREEPCVEVALALGARTVPLIVRYALPSALASLIVQATCVLATGLAVNIMRDGLRDRLDPRLRKRL